MDISFKQMYMTSHHLLKPRIPKCNGKKKAYFPEDFFLKPNNAIQETPTFNEYKLPRERLVGKKEKESELPQLRIVRSKSVNQNGVAKARREYASTKDKENVDANANVQRKYNSSKQQLSVNPVVNLSRESVNSQRRRNLSIYSLMRKRMGENELCKFFQ